MRVINASAEILSLGSGQDDVLKTIEACGRVSYKSEDRMTPTSASRFVKMLLTNGHESVLEHVSATVKFIVDRGVSHEIVRHRIAAYTQESTRYCDYNKMGDVTFIRPHFWDSMTSECMAVWLSAMNSAEIAYKKLREQGAKPQEARGVLPNSLKTEVIMTANLREWRHFFKLRTAAAAHPQMREVTCPLLEEFKKRVPVVFDDIVPCP